MGTAVKSQLELLCNETKDGKSTEKLIKFNQKRFTAAVADAVLPLYNELFNMQKAYIESETGANNIEYEGGNVKATFKELNEMKLSSFKTASKEDYKKYNAICYEIVKNVIDYSGTSEKFKDQIETDADSDFWNNQNPIDVRDFVNSFRAENQLGI